MSDFMSPGRRIRHYRMLRGMTQKALGIAAGFLPETADIRIAQYESAQEHRNTLCSVRWQRRWVFRPRRWTSLASKAVRH